MGDGAKKLSKGLAATQSFFPFVYVGMDANGKSPLWVPRVETDRVGEIVEGFFSKGGLLVLNS